MHNNYIVIIILLYMVVFCGLLPSEMICQEDLDLDSHVGNERACALHPQE